MKTQTKAATDRAALRSDLSKLSRYDLYTLILEIANDCRAVEPGIAINAVDHPSGGRTRYIGIIMPGATLTPDGKLQIIESLSE